MQSNQHTKRMTRTALINYLKDFTIKSLSALSELSTYELEQMYIAIRTRSRIHNWRNKAINRFINKTYHKSIFYKKQYYEGN